jgi:hypothetical protein
MKISTIYIPSPTGAIMAVTGPLDREGLALLKTLIEIAEKAFDDWTPDYQI